MRLFRGIDRNNMSFYAYYRRKENLKVKELKVVKWVVSNLFYK